jgi:hypothetical protein
MQCKIYNVNLICHNIIYIFANYVNIVDQMSVVYLSVQ